MKSVSWACHLLPCRYVTSPMSTEIGKLCVALNSFAVADIAQFRIDRAAVGTQPRGRARVLLGIAAPDRNGTASPRKRVSHAEPNPALPPDRGFTKSYKVGPDDHLAGNLSSETKCNATGVFLLRRDCAWHRMFASPLVSTCQKPATPLSGEVFQQHIRHGKFDYGGRGATQMTGAMQNGPLSSTRRLLRKRYRPPSWPRLE
jgi:hypothetical protein